MSELAKMLKAKKEHHTEEIGMFLEWLEGKGIRLAHWVEPPRGAKWSEPKLCLACIPYEELLAEYVGVDLIKVEKEKQDLLEEIRRKG